MTNIKRNISKDTTEDNVDVEDLILIPCLL